MKKDALIENYSSLFVPARTVRLSVTDDDIADGLPGQPQSCPVHLALRRRLNDGWAVTVGRCGLVLENRDARRSFTIDLPQSATRFITAFDRDLPVKPSRFDVVLPREAVR
jgi:hypothetical protein